MRTALEPMRKQSTRRFMGDSPAFEDQARTEVARVRRSYTLTAHDIERLDRVSAAIAARVNVAP
jgi:hypothetical protein